MIRSRLVRLAGRGRRFGVMLGGEVLQSAFHFALNVVLVRLLAPADYGVFAITMLLGGIGLTYMRSAAGVPANLLIPEHRGRPRVVAFEAMANASALGLAVLFFAVAAVALELWLKADALAGGLFIGLWALRSYLRTFLFAHDEPGTASLSDSVFALAGTLGGLGLLLSGAAVSLETVFLLLTTANAAAIAAALLLRRRPFPVSVRASVRRRLRRIAPQLLWASAGVTTGTVQAQGQVLLIAAIAGPAAYAPIAAMLVVLAPLRLLSSALANMAQPELAALSAAGRHESIRRRMVFWTAGMLLVGASYALAMGVAVPLLGAEIFDGQPRALIGAFAWGISVAPLLYLMPKIALEVRRAFALLTAVNAAAAAVGMAAVAALLLCASPAWSMVGTLLSELVVLSCCWAAVLRRQTPKPASHFTFNPFPSAQEANP